MTVHTIKGCYGLSFLIPGVPLGIHEGYSIVETVVCRSVLEKKSGGGCPLANLEMTGAKFDITTSTTTSLTGLALACLSWLDPFLGFLGRSLSRVNVNVPVRQQGR